jgi:hypothetical protein
MVLCKSIEKKNPRRNTPLLYIMAIESQASPSIYLN